MDAPALSVEVAAENIGGDIRLAGTGRKRVGSPQQGHKPAAVPGSRAERSGELAAERERAQPPDHEQWPLQSPQAAELERQPHWRAFQWRSADVQADALIAIGQ